MIKLIDFWITAVCNIYCREGEVITSDDLAHMDDVIVISFAPFKDGIMVTTEGGH